jgi:ABC-type transport system involved in cytochrome c biogenesis permease subunit
VTGATFFWIALFAYLAAMVIYVIEVARRLHAATSTPWTPLNKLAAAAMSLGFISQTVALLVRGLYVGRLPITTFFGYLSVLSWLIVLAYLIVLFRYRWTSLGAFVAPVAFVVIVIASLFPMTIEEQLIPALQSYWLQIHVSIALLGEAAFAVGFAAGLLYLVRDYKPDLLPPGQWKRSAINLLGSLVLGAFVGGFLFGNPLSETGAGAGMRLLAAIGVGVPLALPYAAISHRWVARRAKGTGFGPFLFCLAAAALLISGVLTGVFNAKMGFVPAESGKVSVFLGVMALISIPIFLILLRVFSSFREKLPKLEILDEVGYKSIAIGWPLFTVGALIAGAIWAHQAWGVYWSWDPKEVGSLVVWLTYALYLHLRAKWGFKASWCAVTAVLGFCAAILTLVGNLVLGGLHSYG